MTQTYKSALSLPVWDNIYCGLFVWNAQGHRLNPLTMPTYISAGPSGINTYMFIELNCSSTKHDEKNNEDLNAKPNIAAVFWMPWISKSLMTSSNGNIFRVTGHLVNSPHKGQWHRSLVFSLICVWINGWGNNPEAGDLRRYCAHYDVIVMDTLYCAHSSLLVCYHYIHISSALS